MQKELHFFDDEALNWQTPNYQLYHANFPVARENQIRYESTPIYSFWPLSLPRIHQYNPAAKLIFVFRDPFERAVSHWKMSRARHVETLPFAEAIRAGRQRLKNLPNTAHEWRVFSYVERGFYAVQVTRALTYFPRRQCLFLRSDDLLNDPAATFAKIANFLDLDQFPAHAAIRENAAPRIDELVPPTGADLDLVARNLQQDLPEFATLTGLDVSAWPTSQAIDRL